MDNLDLSISEILDAISFKYEILSGDPASAPPVSNVTVGEVPDIASFLTGGEIILSTLQAFSQDNSQIEKFIKQLVDRNISALFVKLGRFVPELSDKVLKLANKQGLLMINVTSDVRWTHLIKEIYGLKDQKDVLDIEAAEILKTRLMDSLIYKKGWRSFLDQIEEGIGIPAAIFDKLNNLVSGSSNFDRAILKFDPRILDDRAPALAANMQNDITSSAIYVVPIMWNDKKWGELVFQKRPTDKRLEMVASAARLAEVQVAKEKVELETRNAITNEILTKLRSGQVTQKQISDLKRLGFDAYLGYRVLGIQFMGDRENSSVIKPGTTLDEDERLISLKYLISSVIEDALPNFAVIDDGHKIYVLLGADMEKAKVLKDTAVANLDDILNEPIREIRSRIENYVIPRSPFGLQITISDYVEELAGAAGILLDIDIKFSILEITGKKVLNETNIAFLALLLTLRQNNSEIMTKFAESNLKPIQKYDKEHNANLVETLREYFNTNESIPDTGERIFAHRHTVRYRLKQIEKLTNLNMKSSLDRMILHLALKIDDLKGI